MSGNNHRNNAREGEAPAEPQGDSKSALPVRKHPAHGVKTDIDGPIIIFDTVCTKNRKPWLPEPRIHDILRSVWTEATAWLVGRYIIMPDHVHFFISPGTPEVALENWIQYWKSQFTKRYRKLANGQPPPGRWQTDHWDARLRSWQSYNEKWEYVRFNPVRHGLVTRPEDWPYQGEIYRLSWD